MQNNIQQSAYHKLKIIWAALLGSQFTYGFALYVILKDYEGNKGLENPMMLPVMASAAVVVYALGFFLFTSLLKTEKKKKLNPSIEKMPEIYFTPMIVRLALFEAGVLFGFALAFFSHDISYFIPPLMLNVVLYFMNFPTEKRVQDAFKS